MLNWIIHFPSRYRLHNLDKEQALLVDLYMRVCLSDDDDCIVEIPFFEKQIIPKPLCGDNNGFNLDGELNDYILWMKF